MATKVVMYAVEAGSLSPESRRAPGKGGDTNTLQTAEKKASGFGIFGLMIWLAVRICAVDNNVLSCGD